MGNRAHHLLKFHGSLDGARILARVQLVGRIEFPVGGVCEGRAGDTVDISCSCYLDFNSNGFIGAEIPRIRGGGDAEIPYGIGEGRGSSRREFLGCDFHFRNGHFHQYFRTDEVGDERVRLRQGGACRDSAGRRYLPGAQREQGALS